MTYSEMKKQLSSAIQDGDGILKSDDLDRALQEAVREYSKHRPYEFVDDIVSDGGYDHTLPNGFDVDVSSIQRIEFPLNEQEPAYLAETDWYIYRTTSSIYKLRLRSVTPALNEVMKMTYTGVHILTTSDSTIPTLDVDAVINKAACICCAWLAAHFSQQGENTLNSQAGDHRTMAGNYRAQAKFFCAAFDNFMGLGSEVRVAGAGIIVSMNPRDYPWGPVALTHPRDRRGF